MLNNVTLMGRLVAQPELKQTASGTNVVSFTLAVDRSYVAKGEERKADFINCVAWRSTAEFITRYFDKGQMIALTGEIQSRNYEDKNGNKRTAVEVLVSTVSFCGSKGDNRTASYNAQPDVDFEEIGTPDDLPF